MGRFATPRAPPFFPPLPRSADASPWAGSARQVAAQTRPGRRSRGRHRSRGCWCPFASAAGRGDPCPASRSPAASEAIKPARPSRAGGLVAPLKIVSSSPVRASLPPPALKRCGQSARGLAGAGRAASAPAPGTWPPLAACPWLRVRRGLAGAACPLVLVRRLRLRASHGSAGVAARAPSRSAAPLCGAKGLASPRATHSSVPPLTGRNLRPLR